VCLIPSAAVASRLTTQATYHGSVTASPDLKFAIVVAKFNSLITKGLLEGAQEAFESHGVPAGNIDVRQQEGCLDCLLLWLLSAPLGFAGCVGARCL
jgi:6,7-dimethyl-8-ribityllumazine synthase